MSPVTAENLTSSVFILESHAFFRIGLIHYLGSHPDFTVAGEFGQSRGAVEVILDSNPRVLILNLSLPDGNGLEIIKNLRSTGFRGSILVLSHHDENLYAERSLRAGANGYATKDMAPEKVLEALRTLLNGEVFVSGELNAKLLRSMSGTTDESPDRVSRLTDREIQVLELIGLGLSTRDVASRLGVSSKTVDVHRGNIKRKLDIDDLNGLIRFAVQWLESSSAVS